MAAEQIQELQLRGSEKSLGFRIGFRGENAHADHRVRLRERGGGFEISAVKRERDLQIFRREMRGEGEWQTELRREPRAEIARA